MKKYFISTVIMLLAIVILFGNNVYAASASISASNSEVKKGDTVTIIVSFDQKVSAAQFVLNFDTNKLEYSSYSCEGTGIKDFSLATKKFGYAGTRADISSVSFKFKAKVTGDAKISINNLEISTDTQIQVPVSVGRNEITVKVKQSSSTQTSNKTNTSNKNNNSSTSTDNTPADEQPSDTEITPPVELAPNTLIAIDRKGVTTFRDNISDVMIKGLPIALDTESILEVKVIKETDSNYDKINNIIRKVEGKRNCYRIRLLKNNEVVQPQGYVTVCIPIPDEYDREHIELYRINQEEESYKLISGKIQEDYYTFTENQLATYVLVEESGSTVQTSIPVDNTEETVLQAVRNVISFFTNLKVLYAIIGILILIIIIILIVKARKSKRA